MIKEACVETFEEAVLAEKYGADRIELCSHLELDGLTPDEALIEKITHTLKIPVMVMVRPRGGNFVFDNEELVKMKSDIDMVRKYPVKGVVIGLLTKTGDVDMDKTAELAEYAYPLEVTFHKAIDELKNPVDGVKALTSVPQIKRILTSGGKATAVEGAETIRQMIEAGRNSITIIAAGKVTPENHQLVRDITGASELHGRRIVGELI